MTKEYITPLHLRYTLTIEEAADYFGIGQKKIRQLAQEDDRADFSLQNGNRTHIKRVKFERFIDGITTL